MVAIPNVLMCASLGDDLLGVFWVAGVKFFPSPSAFVVAVTTLSHNSVIQHRHCCVFSRYGRNCDLRQAETDNATQRQTRDYTAAYTGARS